MNITKCTNWIYSKNRKKIKHYLNKIPCLIKLFYYEKEVVTVPDNCSIANTYNNNYIVTLLDDCFITKIDNKYIYVDLRDLTFKKGNKIMVKVIA